MQISKKIHIFLFLVFLMFNHYLFSQESNIKFESISLEDGLSQSTVLCVDQDYKGFMWIGTFDGLNKYDGYTIKHYNYNGSDQNSIYDNVIYSIFEDSEKNLWVGTSQGLCKYDRTKDHFIRIDPKREKISGKIIYSINEDNKGFLWVGTSLGLNRYNKKTGQVKVFKFNFLDPSSISYNKINQIVYDKGDFLWLATDKGLNRFNINTFKADRLNFPKNKAYLDRVNSICITSEDSIYIGTNFSISKLEYDPNNIKIYSYKNYYIKDFSDDFGVDASLAKIELNAQSIVEDKEKIIWIGSEKNGLVRFDPKTQDFKTFKYDPAKRNSLTVNNILTLYQDRTNILWLGTYLGGLNKWNRAADDLDVFRHNPYDPNSLSSNQVRSIYQDNNQNIWIGTVDGGLNKWNKKESKFIHYKHKASDSKSLPHNHVRSMFNDSKGNFWVGTDGGGLALFYPDKNEFKRYQKDRYNKKSISSNKIWKIYEDKRGNLWIGTKGGGLNLYDYKKDNFKNFRHSRSNPNSISHNDITSILEDSNGRLWVGTEGGLDLFNYSDSSFVSFVNKSSDTTSISDDRVYSIFEDSEKTIWIGTKGGLDKYVPKTNSFIAYTIDDGLPNNVVMGILEDNDGNLWLSTNIGLCKFCKSGKVVRNFDVKDGLQSNEFLVGAYCKAKNGEMFFGGINGFNAFFPEKIKDNQNLPSIVITGFRIMNKDVQLDTIISEKKELYLTWQDNVFSFDFVALDYIFPDKNQYKIKMEGYLDEWIDFGTRRYANYTNLPAGKYVFRVIGSNNDGVWNNKGTSIVIHISPPWWKTTWFITTVILLIIALILSWVKYREQKLKHDKRVLEQAVTDRTKQIREKNIELAQKTKDITDSIEYASRIQNAILPPKELLSDVLPDNFVLFKPRDIVSGDYYWMTKKNNLTIVAAADCTGHGVPGAFMSMLGIAFLNEIVNKLAKIESNEILNQLRDYVKTSLNQHGGEDDTKDGMDIALCVINHKENTIEYSGAFNPLIIIRDSEVIEIKADKMPIGIYFEDYKSFTKNIVKVQKNDSVYIYSDGYVDQFGGPRGKKFFSKHFKRMLLEISDKPMSEQKVFLEDTMIEWQGELEQVDDILVMGFKIN